MTATERRYGMVGERFTCDACERSFDMPWISDMIGDWAFCRHCLPECAAIPALQKLVDALQVKAEGNAKADPSDALLELQRKVRAALKERNEKRA